MIINLSSKLVLPLIDQGYVNLYYDSGTTVTPQSNYGGYKTVYVEGIRGSHEVAEFGTSDYTVTPSGGADMIKSVTVKGIKAERLYGSLSEKEQVFTPTSPNVGFSSMQFYGPTNRSVIYAKPLPNDFTYKPTHADDYGIGTLNLSAALLQEKTIEPEENAIPVKPDSGYYGLSKVTVKGGSSAKVAYYTFYGNDSRSFSQPTNVIIKNPTNIIIMNTTDYNSREADDTVLVTAMLSQSSGIIYGEDAEHFTKYGNSYSISDISYSSGTRTTDFTFPWTSVDHATGHLYGLYFQSGVQYFVAIYGT